MEDLIPIGQFAASSRLSPKALRLYDENGLLRPARVDPDSGYRYYRAEQLRTATTIRLLRACGMPRRILRYLRKRLKEAPMFDVQTKRIEELRFASRTKHVRVAELDPFIESSIGELRYEHEATGAPFTLYHGEVNEDSDGPVEVCLPAGDGEKTLPAVEVAYTVAAGADAQFPEILGAYDAVAHWAAEHSRELDGSPREIYVGPATGPDARLEIAWAIR